MADSPSSPPGAHTAVEDALSWYKAQYEQLEHELSEFQASSKELEAELEKDLDAADKRERALQEKAESLNFEVEEWKRKYKESKAEANAAQNSLEKEITTLRDNNRSLQMKLRDIEVANDDYERQARNTTSSLEDMESKYNVAIERAVMMEEEIKIGEQEREQLRVEAQRLREELSDLKIEAEILQDKIKKQEARHLSVISTDLSVPESPIFENSPRSTASSPLITTPPDTKSLSTVETVSELQDPPSPPMSDASATQPKISRVKTPAYPGQRKPRLPSTDIVTPVPKAKPVGSSTSSTRTSGSRMGATPNLRTPAPPSRNTTNKTMRPSSQKAPTSNSLTHIRSLTAQMQRLEARVHSARSKLPGPVNTPPSRISPRDLTGGVPSTITIRSRKRTVGSTTSSIDAIDETTPTSSYNMDGDLRSSLSSTTSKHIPRLSTSGVSRLSFGPLPNRNPGGDVDSSRPSSRASISSYARPGSRTDFHTGGNGIMPPPRPLSRTSLAGSRTPLGRPRSSLSGSLHGHSTSVSYSTTETMEEEDEVDGSELRTPSRRGSTFSRFEPDGVAVPSGIPMPSSISRRQSGSTGRAPSSMGRRPSAAKLAVPQGNNLAVDLTETW